jgi:hypothetical protein
MRRFKGGNRIVRRQHERDPQSLQQTARSNPVDNPKQIAGRQRFAALQIQRRYFLLCVFARFASLQSPITLASDANAYLGGVSRKSQLAAKKSLPERHGNGNT